MLVGNPNRQNASPAHAEAETKVGHTSELQPPRRACEPVRVVTRTSADVPKLSEVVTTRSGRIIKKQQHYGNYAVKLEGRGVVY